LKYQQEKALATRIQVLQAALRVFARKGYSATTLEDVARESGLSRGAIYFSFKNKQDLYVTLVREYYETAIHGMLLASVEQQQEPLNALRDYMFRYNQAVLVNAEIREFMELIRYKTEVKTLSEEILAVQQKMDLLMKDEITLLVRACAAAGAIRQDVPEPVLVMAIHSYLNGIESTWMFNPAIFPLESHLPALIDLFVESMLLPPS
jgi:TetR/AcrR family acrAB operon transcriptional repressor